MPTRRTLKQKVEYRIARKRRDDVFLPREFTDLAGEDQVLRALRRLVREGRLIRLGYGVYARAVRSRLSGRVMIDSPNGFSSAARQALTKLGVAWEPPESERAYNEGRSPQIPANPAVKVKSRFRRRLSDAPRGAGVLRPSVTRPRREGLACRSGVGGHFGCGERRTDLGVWWRYSPWPGTSPAESNVGRHRLAHRG